MVLERMNFHPLFIDIIIDFISSVSYSLLLNGHCVDSFLLSRGLRQGDLLSPYIFIIAMNTLSAALHLAEFNGELEGIQFARRALVALVVVAWLLSTKPFLLNTHGVFCLGLLLCHLNGFSINNFILEVILLSAPLLRIPHSIKVLLSPPILFETTCVGKLGMDFVSTL